jgi:uncharacterized protein with GYD domain
MKKPEDRLVVVEEQLRQFLGVTFLAGGYTFGEHDLAVIMQAEDDATMAAVVLAFLAGGAVKSSRTTPLLTGAQWITALKTASRANYKPAL